MKKKIGEIYDKPIVIGDKNLVTENEIHVDELGGNGGGDITDDIIWNLNLYTGYPCYNLTKETYTTFEKGPLPLDDYKSSLASMINSIVRYGSSEVAIAYLKPPQYASALWKSHMPSRIKIKGNVKNYNDNNFNKAIDGDIVYTPGGLLYTLWLDEEKDFFHTIYDSSSYYLTDIKIITSIGKEIELPNS